MKLNMDGSFDMDLQMTIGGGLVRGVQSQLLTAFCLPFQATYSYDAELHAYSND